MRFLADECCDAVVVRTLRDMGYEVIYVAELDPGVTDSQMLSQSVSEVELHWTRVGQIVRGTEPV